MRRVHWLALAAMLAAAPLWASTRPPAAAADPARADAAVARQRAEVQRLQHAVAAQESGSRAAAERLDKKDAEIAELQQQLRAAQPAGAASGQGH